LTTCAGCLNGLVKPRFGMRRMSGICPPSNSWTRPARPSRASGPLPAPPRRLADPPSPGPAPLADARAPKCEPGRPPQAREREARGARVVAALGPWLRFRASFFACGLGFELRLRHAYSPAFAFAGVTLEQVGAPDTALPRRDGRSCFHDFTALVVFSNPQRFGASDARNAGRPISGTKTCRIAAHPLPGRRQRPIGAPGLALRYFRVGGSLAMSTLPGARAVPGWPRARPPRSTFGDRVARS